MTFATRCLSSLVLALSVCCLASCADESDALSSESADSGVPVRVWSADAGDKRTDAGSRRDASSGGRDDAGRVDPTLRAPGDAGSSTSPIEGQPPAEDAPSVPDAPMQPASAPAPMPSQPTETSAPVVMQPAVVQAPVVDAGTPVAPGGPSPALVAPDAGKPSAPGVDAGVASGAPSCVPGLYRGAFRGQLLGAPTNLAIEGTVSWRLVLDAGGDSMQLREGKVEAQDPLGTPIVGTITGWVQCASKQLRDGVLLGSYGQPGSENLVSFAGTVAGRHAPDKPSLDGTWNASPQGVPEQASGSYQTTLVP